MESIIKGTWGELLQSEMNQPYFRELMRFLALERTNYPAEIFPKPDEVFRALNACPFEDVKVVILGQDPYPTKGHAHGLCFSIEASVRPLPKSLVNIFKEMKADVGIETPENGDLSRWANQGVLLLNSILTIREGITNSHAKKGWEKFTDRIIELLNQKKQNVVYLLWGKYAHNKAINLNSAQNFILKSSHPSPLGVTKSGKDFISFQGSKPFSQTNEYLLKQGKSPIKWDC
jgi:uracil-DNA glycosylase